MSRTAEEIIHDYFICMQDAAKTKEINPARLHFAEDVIYIGPEGRAEGRHQVMRLIQDVLVPALAKLSIQHQFFDKSSGCIVFDLVNSNPHKTHRYVELHKVRNGTIYEIQRFISAA